MATKIKVKKITDLTLLQAGETPDDYGNLIPGVQDIDQIIVAHNTNVNRDDGSAVSIVHTNAMELGQLLEYIYEGLKTRLMTAEDGEELKKLVDQKLQEAENNMAKGNDMYSSNYFVDDSGNLTFNGGWSQEEDGVYYKYTNAFTFKSTGMANCHLTIYTGTTSGTTTTLAVQPKDPSFKAYAKIQMRARNNQWKTICQQPLQNSSSSFDIDLHGYFYAGTDIRGAIACESASAPTATTVKVLENYSSLQITRFSSDKGFPNKSFDWWVSNNNQLTSGTIPPMTISADGFIKFDGLYYHGRIGTVGQKAADYYDKTSSPPWKRRYCMDAVYATIRQSNGTVNTYGNTEGDYLSRKAAGVADDFSGKYYYISATSTAPISAYTRTDFLFKDNAKTSYADSGGGWHNATLIQYVNADEISVVFDNLPYEQLSSQSQLVTEFGLTAQPNYHRFTYSGGLGPYLSATVKSDTEVKKVAPYIGTNSRNTARLELRPKDGTVGCYLREKMGTNATGNPPYIYSFVPAYDTQMMHTLIRDRIANQIDNKPSAEITYTLDLLNENIDWFGVSRDVYRFNSKVVKNNAKSDIVTQADVKNFLSNEVSSGWALTGVDLVPGDYTIGDFGFASCPRLPSFKFPKGASFTGHYTFAAPAARLSQISCTSTSTALAKTKAPPSILSSVEFYGDEGASAYTHVTDGRVWATFANCVNLKRADIQYTDLTALGDHTFLSCGQLLSIELPATCQYVGNSAFNKCEKLSCVILPSSVRSFGSKVFAGCASPLVAANKNSRGSHTYRLGVNYNITIKLSGVADNYYSGGSPDKSTIWSEISGVVNCLQAEGMACTAASATEASRAGRRFYLVDKTGAKLGGDTDPLVFNSIATSEKTKGKFTTDNIVSYSEEPQC